MVAGNAQGIRRGRWLPVIAALAMVAGMAGCARTMPADAVRTAAAPVPVMLDNCCAEPERYPPPVAQAALIGAPVLGRIAAHIVLRQGHLTRHRAARDHIMAALEPLDIVLVHAGGRMTHGLIPGRFAHVAIYVGGERELRASGVWDEPPVAAHRDAISGGDIFIEADHAGVHLSSAAIVLDVDAVVVLRFAGLSLRDRREKLLAYFGHLGTPFDFRFDVDDPECLFCAELVDMVMSETALPRQTVYGRTMIVPDAIVAAAMRGNVPIRVITYVRGRPDGWSTENATALAADLEAEWAPAGERARARSPRDR